MPLNQRVRTVVRREYMQRVRSRWFLFTTLVVPLLFLSAIFIPALLSGGGKESELPIGVVDRTPEHIGPAVVDRLEEAGLAATVIQELSGSGPGGPEDLDALRRSLLPPEDSLSAPPADPSAEWRAILFIPTGALAAQEVTLLSFRGDLSEIRRKVLSSVEESVRETRLERAGITADSAAALLADVPLGVAPLRPEEGPGGFREGIGFAMAMILYMLFIVYGQMIARGVMEEKTSDIVEILVSTVRPWELMLGKVLGVGAVGLTQIGIWALVLALAGMFGLSAAAPWLISMGLDPTTLVVPWDMLGWSAVYFVLGYFLYAAVFAAAGAMVTSEQDVQQVLVPAMMPIILPILLMPAVLGTPDAVWAAAVSLVPFFSPILMPLRLAVSHVTAVESAVALVLLVLAVPGMAWVAGRIYRVGILMKGKRPNLPELVRWLRYG